MKLNARLISISFTIVIVISISSTFIYYSLAGKLISQQQDQSLLNATNDFVFALQSAVEKTENDFNLIKDELGSIKKVDLNGTGIDFMFTLDNDSLINYEEYTAKKNSFINVQSKSFRQFFKNNPNVILDYDNLQDGRSVYFGLIISSSLLDSLAHEIRAEVALVINDAPVDISNSIATQKYLLNVVNSSRALKLKNNFDLYNEELENSDFVASYFTPRQMLTPGGKTDFIIFKTFPESVEFKSTLKNVAIILVLTGSALTFIFVLLFTTKLRKQISLLSEAVEITRKGDLDHRVPVILKDEVGSLGEAFNSMLDEIKRNKVAEKNYTDFIALINQNPSLQEISEAALSKIIKSTGLTFGALYLVEQKSLRVISSFGIGKNLLQPTQDANLYSNAIEKKEVVEFEFSSDYPEIKTGLTSIKLKYLLIHPIIYNRETIAILELASESPRVNNVREYIESIQDQLAIGLINARSLDQLENLVKELKILNEEYQKQNYQIIEQNEKLKELHSQLREKAEELEKQRAKAVELTKVKSQFLASMSHELRTPLISILGLTELMTKDSTVHPKSKERIGIVHRNGKKLLGLITNILEFSKFESGKIEVKKESFFVNEFISEMVPGIKQLCDEKKLKFELKSEKRKNILLNSDKSKLEQILNNLLFNAIKFTESGKIVLGIEVLNGFDVEFSVEDSGIGISKENQKIIFAEFQQADSGTSRKYGGAGLGLAICKKYAELLGGTIKLESKLNKGSRFTVLLPNALIDMIEESPESFLSIEEETAETHDSKILLINDSRDAEKLIVDYLSEYRLEVVKADSYAAALKLCSTMNFESVILNVLKSGDLWPFVTELKKNVRTQQVQLMIMHIDEKEKVGWGLNVYEFVVKPFVSTELKSMIASIELSTNKKISEILFVGCEKSEFDIIAAAGGKNYLFDYIRSTGELYGRIKTELPDVILVDVEKIGSDAVNIAGEISINSLTNKIPVLFLLPVHFKPGLSDSLSNELKAITKRIGVNALDVLKFIKEFIADEQEDLNEKAKQIEEQIPEAEAMEGRLIKKSGNSKPTILIVDDDNDSLFTVGEFVKDLNYDTIFAHNGMECLLTLNHLEPDLILLDIMMPQMDGFETIKRIRADKRFTNLPVIALTAYAMLDNKNVIEKNGFNDLVTKPVNSKDLAAKLKEYIKVQVG